MFPGLYLAPMDGTQYFSSDSVSCKGCLKTKLKDKEPKEDSLCDEDEDAESDVNFSHNILLASGMCHRQDIFQ